MAQNRSINVILNLRDRFTQPIQRTATEARKFQREVKRVENNIKKYTSNMVTNFKNMASNMMKAAGSFSLKAMEKAFNGLKTTAIAAFGAVAGGLTAGVLEGMDYEKYKVQLETATKDTEKAAKLMKNAIDFANKTPFETGQVIEATSLFESMGLSAEKWLSITADMAGATSKDIIQAVEAVIDAVASGEYERLKEFGIKKDSLDGFDASGSLVDQNAMVNSLMGIMEKRFEGGAEALSQTTAGMWSTVTGVFKNSMAKIVGVMDDGSIRAGSVLDRFKKYVKLAGDTLLKWQQDGTIDKIATKFEAGISKSISWLKRLKSMVETTFTMLAPVIQDVITVIKRVFEELKPIIIEVLKEAKDKFKDLIEKIVELSEKVKEFVKGGGITEMIDKFRLIAPIILGIYAAQKLWTLGLKAHELWTNKAAIAQAALNIVTGIWNALAVANPWGLLLTALIAILLLVVFNFDKVKAACIKLWEKWLEVWESIKTKTSEVVTSMKEKFNSFWSGLKEGVKGFANFFIEKINWCIEKLNGLLSFKMPSFLGGAEIGVNIPTIPEFATGTSYHRGGLARINEGGRGEIVNLPNGSQVIPHDLSKKTLSNNVINNTKEVFNNTKEIFNNTREVFNNEMVNNSKEIINNTKEVFNNTNEVINNTKEVFNNVTEINTKEIDNVKEIINNTKELTNKELTTREVINKEFSNVKEVNNNEVNNNSKEIIREVVKNPAPSSNNINIPITIQGNIYGDRDLVDRVGSMIAQRVTLAIGNV